MQKAVYPARRGLSPPAQILIEYLLHHDVSPHTAVVYRLGPGWLDPSSWKPFAKVPALISTMSPSVLTNLPVAVEDEPSRQGQVP